MQLESYRIIFAAIALIGILLFASPTIELFVKLPSDQQFSELYILGPDHMMDDVPFNIAKGVTYSIYVDVGNHMGSSEYYTCYVKLQNATDPLPNGTLGSPSTIPALSEYKLFVENGATWEGPLTFQVNKITFKGISSIISNIEINGVDFAVNKSSNWDTDKSGYYYTLLIELWIYDSALGNSTYHNRSVNLVLNMTE